MFLVVFCQLMCAESKADVWRFVSVAYFFYGMKSAPSNLPESIKNIIFVEKQGPTIIPIAPSLDYDGW